MRRDGHRTASRFGLSLVHVVRAATVAEDEPFTLENSADKGRRQERRLGHGSHRRRETHAEESTKQAGAIDLCDRMRVA